MMTEERKSYLKSKKPIAQIVRGLLESKERILWQGQPIPKYAFWSGVAGNSLPTKILSFLVGIVVLLPITVPGGYWAYTTIHEFLNNNATTSIAIGVVKVLLGLVLLIGPYLWVLRSQINAFRIAKYVHYFITNHRVMMLYIKEGRVVDKRIKPLNALLPPKLVTLGLRGIGSVIYDSEVSSGGGAHVSDSVVSFDVGFDGIANANEVMDILREAVNKHQKGREKNNR